jgi:hypothetical protein
MSNLLLTGRAKHSRAGRIDHNGQPCSSIRRRRPDCARRHGRFRQRLGEAQATWHAHRHRRGRSPNSFQGGDQGEDADEEGFLYCFLVPATNLKAATLRISYVLSMHLDSKFFRSTWGKYQSARVLTVFGIHEIRVILPKNVKFRNSFKIYKNI